MLLDMHLSQQQYPVRFAQQTAISLHGNAPPAVDQAVPGRVQGGVSGIGPTQSPTECRVSHLEDQLLLMRPALLF